MLMTGLAVAALAVLLAGCGEKKGEHAAVSRPGDADVVAGVATAVGSVEAVPMVRELAGSVQAASVSQISARIMAQALSVPVAEGDLVDCHFALLCKHTADFGDLKAKGNALRIAAISTFRVADGKLAEGWELYDSGDMARQMQA